MIASGRAPSFARGQSSDEREPNADGSEPNEDSRVMERTQDRVSFHSLPPSVARIGRYDVLGRIAGGGMAEIYLGRETVQA